MTENSDGPELNEHGFKVPETQVLGNRPPPQAGRFQPTAYTPAAGQDPMTPQQIVAATGRFVMSPDDWNEDGTPATPAGNEQFIAATEEAQIDAPPAPPAPPEV